MVLINIPVRQDNNICPVLVCPVRLQKQPVNGLFKRSVLIIGNGDHFYLKSRLFHGLDLQQIRLCENGIFHLKDLAVIRRFLQDISLLAHIDSGRGNDLFPDRVDGRVSHLSKKLLKVVKQGLMFL